MVGAVATIIDQSDGSLPFKRLTNGQLPLKTIEKPLCPMIARTKNIKKTNGFGTKNIVRPLASMVSRPLVTL